MYPVNFIVKEGPNKGFHITIDCPTIPRIGERVKIKAGTFRIIDIEYEANEINTRMNLIWVFLGPR